MSTQFGGVPQALFLDIKTGLPKHRPRTENLPPMAFSEAEVERMRELDAEQKYELSLRPQIVGIDVSSLKRASTDPAIAEEQKRLFGAVHSLKGEIKELEAQVIDVEIGSLKRAHKDLVKAARAALDAVKAFGAPLATAQEGARDAQFEWNRQFQRSATVRSQMPSVTSYPTDAEMDSHWKRVEAEEAKLRTIEARSNGWTQRLRELETEQADANAALEEARSAVDRSQRRIDRLSGTTSATGKQSSVRSNYGLGG